MCNICFIFVLQSTLQMHFKTLFLAAILCTTLFESCEKPEDDDPVSQPPGVTTDAITFITVNSATVSGTVTTDGNDSVTSRGICYGTIPNPTTSSSVIINGSGEGSFSCNLTALSSNTTYYARAFATNNVHTAYGNQLSFTTSPPVPVDSAVTLFIGGKDTLYALNARTGILKWKVKLTDHISSPAYSNGVVFVNDAAGKVYAYDTSGMLKWTAFTTDRATTYSPVVINNVVVTKDNNGALYVFDEYTGTLKWKKNTRPKGFTVANSTIYTAQENGMLSAFDLQTGAIKWTAIYGQNFPPPIVRNNRVYMASNTNSVVVLNESDGSTIWNRYISDFYGIAINVGYGNVYIVSVDKWIRAIDSATGSDKWNVNQSKFISSLTYQDGAYPLLIDSMAILPSQAAIRAYNAITGAVIFEMPADITRGLTIVNKVMFAGTYNYGDGRISAKDLVNPANSWVSSFKGSFNNSAPCVITKSGKMYRGGEVY